MRRKVLYVIKPQYLWGNIIELVGTQNDDLLETLQKAFRYGEPNDIRKIIETYQIRPNECRKNQTPLKTKGKHPP